MQLQFEQGMQTTKTDIMLFVKHHVRPMIEEYIYSDEEKNVNFIESLISAVYVYDDHIIVWFTLECGKKVQFINKDETTAIITEKPAVFTGSTVNAFGGQWGTRTLDFHHVEMTLYQLS